MPDRERVINGINKILEETDEYDGVLWDALALLKEQHELLIKKQKDLNHALNDCAGYRHKIAEQPQIVRCKDCKHSKSYQNGTMFGCEFGNGLREPDWFCADGERR